MADVFHHIYFFRIISTIIIVVKYKINTTFCSENLNRREYLGVPSCIIEDKIKT